MPSLRGEVQSWGARHDQLFVELQLSAREPAYSIAWRLVDRVRLRGHLAAERVAYFDSLSLLSQAARQPRTWPRFLRWARSEWVEREPSGRGGSPASSAHADQHAP